jgi:cytochrome c
VEVFMKKTIIIVIVFILCIFTLIAKPLGEKEKTVKEFVENAIKFYLANGEEKAFAEFNKTDGKFVKGELYLFVYDFKGKCVSHGANNALIGKDLIDLKDSRGKPVVREFIALVKSRKEGWIDFMWMHPQTKKDTQKRSFVKQIGNKELIIGCGYYM